MKFPVRKIPNQQLYDIITKIIGGSQAAINVAYNSLTGFLNFAIRVDNTGIEINEENNLQLKDEGVKAQHINSDVIGTNLLQEESGAIAVAQASTSVLGITILSNLYDGIAEDKAVTEKALSDGLNAVDGELQEHTLDETIHFTQENISITENQISDLQAYLTSVTPHDINGNEHNGLTGATENNFAGFDNAGKIKDSGSKAGDFASSAHNHPVSDITAFDTSVSSNADVSANTSARHGHDNKSILDNIQEAFTTDLKSTYDTVAGRVNQDLKTTAIPTFKLVQQSGIGFAVTQGAGTQSQWCLLARVTMTAQYQQMFATITLNSPKNYQAEGESAFLYFRVKQEAAMGVPPAVSVTMFGNYGIYKENFKAVVVENSANLSIVELYAKNDLNHQSWFYTVPQQGGTIGITEWLESQSLVANLPAGSQVNCVYMDNYANTININGTQVVDDGGFFKPVSSSDSNAPNNSVYYSTDSGKLAYKDSGGAVNALY